MNERTREEEVKERQRRELADLIVQYAQEKGLTFRDIDSSIIIVKDTFHISAVIKKPE